jgi:hypothetical protein
MQRIISGSQDCVNVVAPRLSTTQDFATALRGSILASALCARLSTRFSFVSTIERYATNLNSGGNTAVRFVVAPSGACRRIGPTFVKSSGERA